MEKKSHNLSTRQIRVLIKLKKNTIKLEKKSKIWGKKTIKLKKESIRKIIKMDMIEKINKIENKS